MLAAKPKLDDIKIIFSAFGPYEKYQSNQNFSYSVVNMTSSSATVYEKFIIGTVTTPLGRTIKTPTHSVDSFASYNSSITLPTSLYLGDDGMKVTCEVYYSTDTKIFTKSITIYPLKSETINPLLSSTYSSNTIRVGLTSSISQYKEKFTFVNFQDYFYSSTYYKLNIDQFVLKWSFARGFSFTCGDCYLLINGYQEYFPGLKYTNGVCKIPLSLYKNGDGYSFIFSKQLYVEPKTLIMSTEAKVGYRATSNFYLPINKKEELSNISFGFEMNDVGLNKCKIAWESSLFADNNLIGNCQSSEYCVVGKVSK